MSEAPIHPTKMAQRSSIQLVMRVSSVYVDTEGVAPELLGRTRRSLS